ncbi:MAG TPA: cob(I)yrinic acid a,c-diamide adenosyltransferase, partial [Marinobacter sp.]|nr:cob(I)yrinic acid a,c-diamide adenosyltransferase [Marinobacter sp.]
MKVGIVQFIKGAFSTGEEAFFRSLPNVTYHVMGQGYTWDTQNRKQDVKSATDAWEVAASMLSDDSYDLVLLDELNIALKYDYIDLDRVLDDLQARPEMQHVVVTGRGAPQELIDLADTVTEMGVVKHAFKDQGIKAQKGVEL